MAARSRPSTSSSRKSAASKPARTRKAARPKADAPRARSGRSTAAARPNKPPASAPRSTVAQYLALLPPDRRDAIEAVRSAINARLPRGYEEGIQYGMIGWYVPHSVYPPGYHCDPKQPLPFAAVASQKNHLSIYLMCIYGDAKHKDWFEKEWKKTGLKLDIGKACIRFKKIEDVPLGLLGEAVARVPVAEFIKVYESAFKPAARKRT